VSQHIRDRIQRKLAALGDDRLYQVLDFVEFLELKYPATQPAAAAGNPLQKFADGVEDRLRTTGLAASTVAEAMGFLNKAVGVLGNVATAAQTAAQKVGTAVAAAASRPRRPALGPPGSPRARHRGPQPGRAGTGPALAGGPPARRPRRRPPRPPAGHRPARPRRLDDPLQPPSAPPAPAPRRGATRPGAPATCPPARGAKRTLLDTIRQIPQYLRLLGGLVRDRRVSLLDKALVAGAIAYIVSPIDLIPDFIPFLGQVDDVFLLMASLERLVANAGEDVLHDHWHGEPGELDALNFKEVLGAATVLLPGGIKSKLVRLVRNRGRAVRT
jgi:uncharacterized membrane protein YkvA (DUF1232 family)